MKRPGTVKTLLCFIFLAFFLSKIAAQLSASDSIFYQKAIDNAVASYHHSLNDQSGLYNGSEYPGYPFRFKEGHPFFYTDKPMNGSVVYDHIFYKDINLQFDEVAGEIILYETDRRIQLIKERISRVSILNNNFIRIVRDSLNRAVINTGFYQLLYEGNTSLLKKEIKIIAEDLRSLTDGILRNIETTLYYYIKKNNVYHPVKRKKDLLVIFKERKKEIQQFIKTNKLSFKKDRDNMLIKVVSWYDHPTK